MNRFVLIGLIVTGVLTVVPASNLLSCKDVSLPYGIFALFTYLIWAVVSAQRVLAISKCNWGLTGLTFSTGLVPLGVNIYDLTQLTYSVMPGVNECEDIYNYSDALPTTLTIVSRTNAIVSDVIVLGATWYYTRYQFSNPLYTKPRQSLALLMLRDGTLYFLLFLVLNILRIVLDHFHTIEVLQIIMVPMSSVLVSRFMLNVRAVVHATSAGQCSELQTLTFTRPPAPGFRRQAALDDTDMTLAAEDFELCHVTVLHDGRELPKDGQMSGDDSGTGCLENDGVEIDQRV